MTDGKGGEETGGSKEAGVISPDSDPLSFSLMLGYRADAWAG
jgi:hypothetical protein